MEGELHGKSKKDCYIFLDSQGKKISNPFKASLFGEKLDIDSFEKHIVLIVRVLWRITCPKGRIEKKILHWYFNRQKTNMNLKKSCQTQE